MEEEIARALEVLRKGGVILYPTDTVWGIGCDATNERAVQRIYELKRSENKKGMLVLMASADQTARYVDKAPEVAWQLMEVADKPLTLILPGAVGVAPNLIPEEGTLGVRVPRHAFCEGLLRRLGRPLVSTSANLSGEPAPASFGDISQEIRDGVDYAVDPRCEGDATGRASSIILLGEGGEVKIIRE
ncbi:L-threonylcarbamoyladenylate synthase [Gallalistipes aquisgranensis]|uniref:L-threonylcarbamoyladenylate synthase n=1 Tax=Gallalistipes aquisgranensis TaxID=2779358 RepID=UPI001CF82E18|nr:L-threonylcarbamoyladenylate synthase [Gallalistipes aquisgranensis]MBE5033344.1 threonylcarbamoyl-AMP synthase [Gallalistipes aquisgranensis]